MAVNKQLLQFGIIGCGRIVQGVHLSAWRAIKHVRLVAICDPFDSALQAISARYPKVRKYSDVDSFLADAGDLDFVVLATPADSHFAIGEKILRNKRHLLCEKPLALNERDAQHLYDVAETEGVILTPIHNYKYRDSVMKALSYAENGALGDVVSFTVRYKFGSLFKNPVLWRREERKQRVLLFDIAFHSGYLAFLFAGALSSVRFVDAEVDSAGLQYVVFGTLHNNGCRGLFELMLDASCYKAEMEVLGERGGFMLDFLPHGFRVLPRCDTPLHRGRGDLRLLFNFASASAKSRLLRELPARAIPHSRLFSAFIDTIRTGAPNPVSKAETMQTISLLSQVAKFAYEKK
jgi:predicted dehydrogenase